MCRQQLLTSPGALPTPFLLHGHQLALPHEHRHQSSGMLRAQDCVPGTTLRLSTGRVTLNMSMVLTMMAGVVRKKRRMKRQILRRMNRTHQDVPRTDKFSLREENITWMQCRGNTTVCLGSSVSVLQCFVPCSPHQPPHSPYSKPTVALFPMLLHRRYRDPRI